MIVAPEYVRTMARYNAWQNDGLRTLVDGMSDADLRADRGAFFGSIFGTLNHLLWGDTIWMSRFADLPPPPGGIKDSPALCRTVAEWATERYRMDRLILHWARGLRAIDLEGDLSWYSGAAGRQVSRPLGLLVMHFFNHQTHHRGQVHAMLTAAGAKPGDTDLFLMPEETT
jgi:uncharacterized damage-inducible protein DinB